MITSIRTTFIPVAVLLLTLSACSSDSDSDTAANSGADTNGGTNTESPEPVPFRVVAIEDDFGNDLDLDQRIDLDYDGTGRVLSVTLTEFTAGSATNEVTSFTYDGNNLVARMDPFQMVNYIIEDDRVVAIEGDFSGDVSFTYDDEGRITEVVGDTFFFDDDCVILTPAGADPVSAAPQYSLDYDVQGRLAMITGSFGDITSISYNSNGRVDTLTNSGECISPGVGTTRFTYNSANLPIRAEGSSVSVVGDEETATIDISYDGDRPVRVVFTDTSVEFGTNVITQDFRYNSDGLLEQTVSTFESNDPLLGMATFSQSRTFIYENQSCVQQTNASPVDLLIASNLQVLRPFENALGCGFLADLL